VGRAFIALVCAAGCVSAQSGRAMAELHYKQLIDRGVVTGAYFAEVAHGEVIETSAFGKSRPDSLWRAASTSKALTAVGIMRLVEQGRLNLDVDVNRYLNTLRVPATKRQPITLRHLLTHSSGLDDPFVGSAFLNSAGVQPPLAAVMRDWLPARLYEPGEARLYSNFGYGLAGAVIEDVTGKLYEDFMRSEVLEPLGMNISTFQQPLPRTSEHRVVPSLERSVFGFTHPAEILYHRVPSGGGLTTTLADLLRFVRFIQNGGWIDERQVLRPQTLKRMLGENASSNTDSESYGFGVGTNRGERYWYAGGDLGGYHTILLWFPEHERALVTMAASTSNVATWNLVSKIMETWFGNRKNSEPVPISPHPSAREFAVLVAGTYRPVRYPHHDLGKTCGNKVHWFRARRREIDVILQLVGDCWGAVCRYKGPVYSREPRRKHRVRRRAMDCRRAASIPQRRRWPRFNFSARFKWTDPVSES
jgi:CubicO group peptidase (beta-lactamase class C family)